LHTELLPVSGTNFKTLDHARVTDYLAEILNDPEIPTTSSEWEQRCESLGLLVPTESGGLLCSIAGLVLFGIKPRRFLRQTGLRLMVFDGPDMDYAAKLDVLLDAPL
ncbi:MAG: transcriptional regulator, partial [Planctomyces sp.]